jgi:Uri superfamily endonuclease
MAAMLENIIQAIPAEPGSYLLWLHLDLPQDLTVGSLGRFGFPSGDYLYLGSAQGPGGLRARLGRHLRGSRKPHWHIDHLRVAAQVHGFGFQTRTANFGSALQSSLECEWSLRLAVLSEASLPAPGFGASDCRSGCTAHLVHLKGGIQQILPRITDEMNIYLKII